MMAGGNAIDAAIATAAALGVVEPHSSGVGGDGFILIYWAETGELMGVNATGPAPQAATREVYLENGGIPMKGIRSVSVPGLVDGWLLAHERCGALKLEQAFEPAMRDIEALIDSSQERVSGEVRVRLDQGHFSVTGVRSPHSMMDSGSGVYGEMPKLWDGQDTRGYGKIVAVPARLHRSAAGGESK